MNLLELRRSIIASEPHLETVETGNTEDSDVIASFKANATLPIKSMIVNFEPIQEGEGDPSPDNIRPITGLNRLTVKRCGKNLFDEQTTTIYSRTTSTAGWSPSTTAKSAAIKVSPNTTYTISAYFKSMGATTGTTYPSLLPYDADNNFIHAFNCAEGFNSTFRTTLAQPLKKGDTVVYATDLSAWTTGDNHYFHVAIFGYKDSFGRIYPDMGYTKDSPVFGTKTDKSHINKANNTITLNAPYTGEDRPAGTVICQATEGSTYVYPFGGIALSTLSNWVFKTATLDPNYARLKYAKYMPFVHKNTYLCDRKRVLHLHIVTNETFFNI